jgi:hypothetical protein
LCGTVKFETRVFRLGELVPVRGPHGDGDAKWGGFAKTERQDYWMKEGNGVPINFKLESFTEGKDQCAHAIKGVMMGIGLRKTIKAQQGEPIGVAGDARILTRAAITPYEIKTHSRWPLVINEVDGRKFVQTWDKPDGPAQGSLDLKQDALEDAPF